MEYFIVPKYCDSGSILLINTAGKLKRLYCPFRVKCVVAVGSLKPGMWLWVDEAASNEKDELIYYILEAGYCYAYFEIIIIF